MALVKVEWGGTIWTSPTSGLGSPYEVWSNSLHLVTSQVSPNMTTAITPIATAVQAFFNDTAAAIVSSVQLDYVKANEYSLSPPYNQITDPTVMESFPSGDRGPRSTTNQGSSSNAVRISLDNGTRNKHARGGFFIPMPEVTIQAGGRIFPSGVTDIRTAATTFIHALNAIALGGSWHTVVWSPTAGEAFTVTRLRVGDVLDDISRRRNALKETYQTAVITP